MSDPVRVGDLDLIYLSYDEPQAEEFWADLRNKAPWAKRVHGVTGFDAAHKRCAGIAETDLFITVDGDNRIDPAFLDLTIQPVEGRDAVYSWAGRNAVNGLVYGNGGLKIWSRAWVRTMQTHEHASDDRDKVDFCWAVDYVQMNDCFSEVHSNGSPYQAFRSGFREGIKLMLKDGVKSTKPNLKTFVPWQNLKRYLVWASVGADQENGLWCQLGARMGTAMLYLTDWDYALIRDYDWFQDFWADEIAPQFAGSANVCRRTGYGWDPQKVRIEMGSLGRRLREELNLYVADLDVEQSRFCKEIYLQPLRLGAMMSESRVSQAPVHGFVRF